MTEIWHWMFSGGKSANLLISSQEKARQNFQNCQAQVRLGNLLTEMGKKKAALEVYRQAAEYFSQEGLIVEATGMRKVVMRLHPLQRETQ